MKQFIAENLKKEKIVVLIIGKRKKIQKKFTLCCNNGKIKLPDMKKPPTYIKELLLGETQDAKLFYKFSRKINSAVSFCSITSKNTLQFNSNPHQIAPPSLLINGNIHHNLGSIYRDPNDTAPVRNMQTYFCDPQFDVQMSQEQETEVQKIIYKAPLKLRVLTGPLQGEEVILPHLDLIPSDPTLPIKFSRRQFPIKISYAMTINKSQGQSLKNVVFI